MYVRKDHEAGTPVGLFSSLGQQGTMGQQWQDRDASRASKVGHCSVPSKNALEVFPLLLPPVILAAMMGDRETSCERWQVRSDERAPPRRDKRKIELTARFLLQLSLFS